jgi:hypothetical protein
VVLAFFTERKSHLTSGKPDAALSPVAGG